ncbi:MAG: 6-carboxytetrahydropterin synthase [Candidatus Omnitrophica bacterium]|nr:6-carboxytetrahydropterin synthase [Candidatus Omnitrophota bacterium]
METQATYTIKVESRFEAAHNLRQYYGAPEPVHGHSWRVEARMESSRLDAEDISVDFVKVEKALHALAAKFDHNYINNIPPFDTLNPTSENIAKWFYEGLNHPELLGGAHLVEVTLWEGPFNTLTYRPRRER